jgi:competence protein ComEA
MSTDLSNDSKTASAESSPVANDRPVEAASSAGGDERPTISGWSPDVRNALTVLLGVLATLGAVHTYYSTIRQPAVRLEYVPGRRNVKLIPINRADAVELTLLPGVGPALAERLIRRRDEVGPFRNKDDLREVPGIGAVRADAIAPHVDYSTDAAVEFDRNARSAVAEGTDAAADDLDQQSLSTKVARETTNSISGSRDEQAEAERPAPKRRSRSKR